MSKSLGDIRLDGHDYRVEISSYHQRDVTDFSPRASVPGGSVIHSELGMYQPLLQTDWKHGFGFTNYEDASGYQSTKGDIDTRHSGIVSMFTTSTLSESDNNAKEGFTTFNSAAWSWGAAGLRKYSSSAWASAYSTAAVNYAVAAGDYLFYAPDGARVRKVNKSDTHSDAGNDANATDYKWLIIHAGYIWAGKDDTNYIHRDSTADLSDLEGTTADPDMITVGPVSGFPTLGAIVYASYLYVSTADGLWVIGEDDIARRVLDFTNEASDDNFRSMSVHNGYLVFPIRDKIYQWNGARLSDITPPRLNDSFPYLTYGHFDTFVSMGRFLYCSARTNRRVFNIDLLCFDGVAWHKLTTLLPSTTVGGTGVNLVANGDFETGDLTNWTASDADYFASSELGAEVGTYGLSCENVTTGTETLTSDRIAATAGTSYKLSLKSNELWNDDYNAGRSDDNEIEEVTLTLNPAEATANDTYISSGATTTNYGTSTQLMVGEDKSNSSIYRTLIKFDLSTIPTYATVTSAVLTLKAYIDKATNDSMFLVYLLKRAWVEAQATWNIFATGSNWGTAGGFATTDVQRDPPIGKRAFTANEELPGAKEFTLSNSAIRKIVRGDWTNNGFLIKSKNEDDDAYVFRSSSAGTASNYPELEIKYKELSKFTVQVKWYDDPSAGNLLSTDTLASETHTLDWTEHSASLTAPTSTQSCEIIITTSPGNGYYIDNVSMIATEPGVTGMGYDAVNNYLWYHIDTNADKTYYIPHQDDSEFPYPSFTTTGVHRLITSRMDMGYRWVKKVCPSVIVEASSLSSDEFIRVRYKIDDEPWDWLGDVTAETIPGESTPISTSRKVELKFGKDITGDTQGVIEFYNLTLSFEFHTNKSSRSPVLEGCTVRFLMRPMTIWGWSFSIPIAKGMDMGESIQYDSVKDVISNLRTSRGSTSPIVFTDIFNRKYRVYITSLTIQAIEHDFDEGGNSPNVESLANLNLVQVK